MRRVVARRIDIETDKSAHTLTVVPAKAGTHNHRTERSRVARMERSAIRDSCSPARCPGLRCAPSGLRESSRRRTLRGELRCLVLRRQRVGQFTECFT
ncbi:hypothetical protein CWO90_34900 [Bradyrhizobium sp. Leo121]|nr:hypothetical protein CWO90_34900 [Bradyrhizobium sp. Leo121]